MPGKIAYFHTVTLFIIGFYNLLFLYYLFSFWNLLWLASIRWKDYILQS